MDIDGLTTKAKIIILYAMPYDMITERQEQLKGCSVQYLFWGESGEKLFAQSEWDTSKPIGVQRAKCSVDYTCRQKIVIAPALYEGTFEMRVGGDGKPVLKLTDVAYISDISFAQHYVPGLVVPGMIPPPADLPAAKK